MSAYGTVTRSAPAGRRPPKPSLQIHLFMKKEGGPQRAPPFRSLRNLQAAVESAERDALLVVGGDFNAQLGARQPGSLVG